MANNNPFNKPKQIYVDPNKLETIEPKLPPLPQIAKAQNVTPKQVEPQAEEIAALENQIAQAQTQDALNQFARSQEEEELKKQTIANLMNQLQKQVDVPKRLTIADIMNGSNFGERLGTLAQYAQQPEFQRNLGNLMGTRLFNPNTGRFESTGNRDYAANEARFMAQQKQAMDEEQNLNKLNADIYGIMNGIDTEAMREDRFNRQMAQQNEQFYQSLGQRAAENAAKIQADREALQRQMEQQNFLNEMKQKEFELAEKRFELEREKAEGKGSNPYDIMQQKDRDALKANNESLLNLQDALKSLEEAPDAYTWYKGKMGSTLANRLYPNEKKARAQIDNITAVYRKWLTGAQMSDKEREAYYSFLPAPTDNYEIVKTKLNVMIDSINNNTKSIMMLYPQLNDVEMKFQVDENADPMGLGL